MTRTCRRSSTRPTATSPTTRSEVNGTQAYTVGLTGGSGAAVGRRAARIPTESRAASSSRTRRPRSDTVFQENLQFALDLARSATQPDDPKSHPRQHGGRLRAERVRSLHGDPQRLEVVNARKALGAVTAHWRVSPAAASATAPTSEWDGGLRYGTPGTYYHHLRATVETGATPGQQVEVWFSGGGKESEHFTYTLASDSGCASPAASWRRTTSATGASSTKATAPYFQATYDQALTGAGIAHDVYDVDARGRKAPSALGVLSHYDAVVWETGGDLYTREGEPAGRHRRVEAARRRGARRARLHERGAARC